MNKNTRFGIIAIALAGLAGLGYYAYTANRSQAAGFIGLMLFFM